MPLKRDYNTNPPTKISELNKQSMAQFVKSKGDKKEIKWFIELLDANTVKKTYNFDTNGGAHKKGEEYDGLDMPPIRKAFAKRYFPDLLKKKEYKKPDDFGTLIKEMRKELE